jgi:hypothetical protein
MRGSLENLQEAGIRAGGRFALDKEGNFRNNRITGSVLDVDMDSHKPLIFWT